jgi:hypothetical protein
LSAGKENYDLIFTSKSLTDSLNHRWQRICRS